MLDWIAEITGTGDKADYRLKNNKLLKSFFLNCYNDTVIETLVPATVFLG